jgi:hypothetical protein
MYTHQEAQVDFTNYLFRMHNCTTPRPIIGPTTNYEQGYLVGKLENYVFALQPWVLTHGGH